jgi:hypothetical protein
MLAVNNSDVSQLLQRWSKGDQHARDALMPLVYENFRQLAN